MTQSLRIRVCHSTETLMAWNYKYPSVVMGPRQQFVLIWRRLNEALQQHNTDCAHSRDRSRVRVLMALPVWRSWSSRVARGPCPALLQGWWDVHTDRTDPHKHPASSPLYWHCSSHEVTTGLSGRRQSIPSSREIQTRMIGAEMRTIKSCPRFPGSNFVAGQRQEAGFHREVCEYSRKQCHKHSR